jgi:hypothetical protein
MNSTTQYSSYELERQRQQLEALVQPKPQAASLQSHLTQALHTLGTRLVAFLTVDQGLRIWQRTRYGQTLWFVHDPVTNQTRSFQTEEDVYVWLDQRYNQ